MDDGGISLTGLTIGGAALTAIGGVLGSWYKAKYGRTEIHPQPLVVREDKAPASAELCNERHSTHSEQIRELFIRINLAEQSLSSLKALKEQVQSMDSKLDAIIGKLGGKKK